MTVPDASLVGDEVAAGTDAAWPGEAEAGSALTLGAPGVVFGDIGTSPLYAVPTAFSVDQGEVKPTAEDVDGVISLVFWSITLIVSVKYGLSRGDRPRRRSGCCPATSC